MDTTIKRGKRAGTFQAFLRPALLRKNLFIVRFSHVIKINFDKQLRAVGVTYVRDGVFLSAIATKEIIISAGAVGTPHLLMLSGLGPAQHLKDNGVNA